jgi:hypothetical protein
VTALRYVYGIVPAGSASAVDGAGLRGIDDGRVRTIVVEPFAAACSDVDAGEYGDEGLNDRVRDLDWLTPRASSHQAVNARLLELAGVVLPLSFGALYRDDDRVREMLREDVPARKERLRALSGRAEWVVTVLRGSGRDTSDGGEALHELDREIASSAPGKGYLLTKRRAAVAKDATERADTDAADRALTHLVRAGERTYRESVVQGGDDVVVLRVSLLAPRSNAGSIDGTIAAITKELEPLGYHVRATGPWPAYRFGAL